MLWQATMPAKSTDKTTSSGGTAEGEWKESNPANPTPSVLPFPGDSLGNPGGEYPKEPPSGNSRTSALPGASASSPDTIPLENVFRFDLTVRDILARWPRVSTSLADLQLQGYRVPLVTGPAETDLAGALTYYFNSYQQLQRITFQGTTGDGRELVHFLTTRYGFQRRVVNDPSLFIYEVPRLGGQPQSVLRMKLAPTLKTDRPHQRFDVSLVLEKPEEPPKPFWERLGRNR